MKKSQNTKIRSISLLSALALFGCGEGMAPTNSSAAQPDVLQAALDTTVQEGSPEAIGILRVANTASQQELDVTAGLDSRAAQNIITYRNGPDGIAGSADDQVYDTLAELDAISYVATVAFDKLLSYAYAQGYVPEVCDGVDNDKDGQVDEDRVCWTLEQVNAGTLPVSYYPEITVDKAGRPWVLFQTYNDWYQNSGQFGLAVRNGAASWSQKLFGYLWYGAYGSLAVDPAGNLQIAWYKSDYGAGIYYTRVPAGGAPSQVTDGTLVDSPNATTRHVSIAATGTDALTLIYHQFGVEGDDLRIANGGPAGWTRRTAVTAGDTGADGVQAAMTPSGPVYAYVRTIVSGGVVTGHFAVFMDTNGVTTDVAQTPYPSSFSMATASDGTVYLATASNLAGYDTDLWSKKPGMAFQRINSFQGSGADVAVGPNGKPVLCHYTYQNSQYSLFLRRQDAAGAWVSESIAPNGARCAIAVDASNTPHIVYRDEATLMLRYAARKLP